MAPGDVYCEVETDKATMAWESQEEGFIAQVGGRPTEGGWAQHAAVSQSTATRTPFAGCCSTHARVNTQTHTHTQSHTHTHTHSLSLSPPLSQILLPSGAKDVPVGVPAMVLVEDKVRGRHRHCHGLLQYPQPVTKSKKS